MFAVLISVLVSEYYSCLLFHCLDLFSEIVSIDIIIVHYPIAR